MPGDSLERRQSIRFPLRMDLRYNTSVRSPQWVAGQTVNISSSGLLMHSDTLPAKGSKVSVMVQWPQLLDNRIPLRLLVTGKVVRIAGQNAAVSVKHFEFRTGGDLGAKDRLG